MCHVHKKKSPKHHKKESFKDSLLSFKSHQNLSRVYHHAARARQSDQKRLQNLSRDRARKKKQSDNEKRRALFRAAEEEKRSEKRSGEMCFKV